MLKQIIISNLFPNKTMLFFIFLDIPFSSPNIFCPEIKCTLFLNIHRWADHRQIHKQMIAKAWIETEIDRFQEVRYRWIDKHRNLKDSGVAKNSDIHLTYFLVITCFFSLADVCIFPSSLDYFLVSAVIFTVTFI